MTGGTATALIVLLVLAGCATSPRFLWEEYTGEALGALRAGEVKRAERFLSLALDKAEQLGPGERGISMNGLGEVYRRQGRLDEAEPLLLRALELKEQALGPDHPDLAPTLTNLGLVYAATGRVPEAALLFERALAIQEKKVGGAHPALRRTLIALADVYRRAGREEDARAVEDRVRDLRPAQPAAER